MFLYVWHTNQGMPLILSGNWDVLIPYSKTYLYGESNCLMRRELLRRENPTNNKDIEQLLREKVEL